MGAGQGDVYDSLVNPDVGTGIYGDVAWNADIQAGATNAPGEYLLEARIPFKDLASAPKAGEVWGANFCRFRPGEHAWSPTYGGFHSPANFGTVSFVDKLAGK